jgi:hypothetical protein
MLLCAAGKECDRYGRHTLPASSRSWEDGKTPHVSRIALLSVCMKHRVPATSQRCYFGVVGRRGCPVGAWYHERRLALPAPQFQARCGISKVNCWNECWHSSSKAIRWLAAPSVRRVVWTWVRKMCAMSKSLVSVTTIAPARDVVTCWPCPRDLGQRVVTRSKCPRVADFHAWHV